MILKKWNNLPESLRIEEVWEYYKILSHKKLQLILKRIFDLIMSLVLLILLSPVMLFLAVWIKGDSKGPIFFRQVRITQYGKPFKIYKFRTMMENAEKLGGHVTRYDDMRITKCGRKMRYTRLDEIPQLINILLGDMSFVGTRPEVPKYVEKYTPEMKATLLLPAGVTSLASIYFKDEARLLEGVKDIEKAYVEKVLPEKMRYNLRGLRKYGFWRDIKIIFMTLAAVWQKDCEKSTSFEDVEEKIE